MSIGEKIKNMRLTQSLTQDELADRCELSKSFISLLERDLTSPSIATLTDILDVFNTTLEDFLVKKRLSNLYLQKKMSLLRSQTKMELRLIGSSIMLRRMKWSRF